MAQFYFFSGKGGVGKSTMAATTAVYHAMAGRRTLLVSTDPAGNLGDIFETEISTGTVSVMPELDVIQLDSDKITEAYKRAMLAPLEEIFDEAAMETVREQFNGGCTVEIATFDRFTDFLSETGYDLIIFDTAPTGHTLRLMTLPGEWSAYITKSAAGSGQTCIGPVSQIQDAKDKYDEAVRIMQDPSRTTMFLVARPEKTSVFETLRARNELEKTGISRFEIIINGVYPSEISAFRELQDPFIANLYATGLPVRMVSLQAGEIKGLSVLQRFGKIVFRSGNRPHTVSTNAEAVDSTARRPNADANASAETTSNDILAETEDFIEGNFTETMPFSDFAGGEALDQLLDRTHDKRILVFTGKGGVGKTVISCATAVQAARRGKTLLLTTDPASHIGEVLETRVDHTPREIAPSLWAANIDQHEAAEVYKAHILRDAANQGYTEDLLESLREELDSPCTEEIAVFERFAGYLQDAQWEYIVLDTAPTGHTLRLLELPFDYQKQLGDATGTGPESANRQATGNLIRMMKDPLITAFLLVAYPEFTPLHESQRAAADLARVGIPIQGVVLNQILNISSSDSKFMQARWRMQQHYLSVARDLFPEPLFAAPLQAHHIVGLNRVDELRAAMFASEGMPTSADIPITEARPTSADIPITEAWSNSADIPITEAWSNSATLPISADETVAH
jgi:arsenite/tail-anchored protein-transporting ATPase